MRKLNITVIAGVIAALLGVLIVVTYGHGVDKRVADGKQTIGVLVASAVLPAGAKPSEISTKVVVKQVPRAYASVDALGALTALSPNSILKLSLPAGATLTKSAFTNPTVAGNSGILGAATPAKGYDAVAIQVAMVPGVAHYITAGSTVDLFVTYKQVKVDPNATITNPVLTKLFASAVKVLSITPTVVASASTVGDNVLLVVEASPSLAQTIINAQAGGDLYAG